MLCGVQGIVVCEGCSLFLASAAAEMMVFSGQNEFCDADAADSLHPTTDNLGGLVRVKGFGFGKLSFVGLIEEQRHHNQSRKRPPTAAGAGGTGSSPAAFQGDGNGNGNGLLWFGVTLDKPVAGGTSGSLLGRHYFSVDVEGTGVFVSARSQCVRLVSVQRLVQTDSSIRICKQCRIEVDETCDAAQDREFAMRARVLSDSNPPWIIRAQKRAAFAIRALNGQLPAYLDKALRLAQHEGLGHYEAACAELTSISHLMDTLRAIYSAIQRRYAANATDAASAAAAAAASVQRETFEVYVAKRSDLAQNIAFAIKARLEAVPKDLLRLPSTLMVAALREQRRVERERNAGSQGSLFLTAWEHERKIPFFGFDKKFLPNDPFPWIKITDSMPRRKVGGSSVEPETTAQAGVGAASGSNGPDGFLSTIVQLFSAAAGKHSRDDLVPQPGCLFAEDSVWRIDYGGGADEDGWYYCNYFATADGKWDTVYQASLHWVRRRKWFRRQEPRRSTVPGNVLLAGAGGGGGAGVEAGAGERQHPYFAPLVEKAHVLHCSLCAEPFSMMRWKHHCRHCGNVTCHDCSLTRVYHPGHHAAVRTCDGCCKSKVFSVLLQLDEHEPVPTGWRVNVVEIYECARQRISWSSGHLLPGDKGRWKNESCTEHYEFREEFELTLPGASRWVSAAWFIDNSLGDADGWEYATTFPHIDRRVQRWHSAIGDDYFVRRRKWFRKVCTPPGSKLYSVPAHLHAKVF